MTPTPDLGPFESDLSATIITCSFRDDLDSCRMLCDSVDRFVPEGIAHRIYVPTADLALFADLETPRRRFGTGSPSRPERFRTLEKTGGRDGGPSVGSGAKPTPRRIYRPTTGT